MSKAFVIKNKEGKYLQYFDADSDDIGFTDDLTLAILYDKNEKDIMKEAYSNMEWEYVEVTIAEGDLEQENKELKERIQNILDGKEIPSICANKYEEYEEQLAIREKEIRKQVCEKLRNIFSKKLYGKNIHENIKVIKICNMINDTLDQIEQAKESLNGKDNNKREG